MVPSRSLITSLIDAGQLKHAAELIDAADAGSPDLKALRLEIERQIGNIESAAAEARGLLRGRLTLIDRVLCLQVLGRASATRGPTDEGIGILRSALSLAAKIDPLTHARSQSLLAETVLHWVGVDTAAHEVILLQRLAMRAGCSRSLIDAHLMSAEIEVKGHRTSRAHRHLKTATSLLETFPNLVQLAKAAIIAGNDAVFQSNVNRALIFAREALEFSEHSGAVTTTVPALSLLAHVFLSAGRYDEAEAAIVRLIAISRLSQGVTRVAALDTYAQILLARGELSGAAAKLDEAWVLSQKIQHGLSYYGFWLHLTRTRLLTARKEYDEAARCGRRALEQAEQLHDNNFKMRLSLALAEAYALAADARNAAEYLRLGTLVEELPPEITAYAEYIVALIRQTTDPVLARMSSERALSLLDSIEMKATAAEIRRTLPTVLIDFPHVLPTDEVTSSGLMESLRMICDLLTHSRLAGIELIELLQRSGVARHAVLVEFAGGDFESRIAGFGDEQAARGNSEIRVEVFRDREAYFELYFIPASGASASVKVTTLLRIIKYVDELYGLRKVKLSQSPTWSADANHSDTSLVVASDAMTELLATTRRVAPSNITVLITGETGTGKELLARAVHDASPRSQKPFIPFNCTAISREMLDAQLFGYKRGAFTGATEAFSGVIRAAAGGTLFLDEIGELSAEVQPKLLRFLESGEIHPLGEPRPLTVDVRVVAATNADLEQLVADGRFREDLFYRLNVVRLDVPPLRQRREEIPLLVQHYIERASRDGQKNGIRVAEETMEYLVLYRWPGNVRQLANEIRRIVTLAESGAVIMPEHLSPQIAASRRTIPASERDLAPTEFVVRMDQPISAATEHLERSMIQYALKLADGRVEEAAQLLGLSRKGLYLKRQRLGVETGTDDEAPGDQDAPRSTSA